MMQHKPTAEMLRWFRNIGSQDTAEVGGKGASLGELTQAGMRVPSGFVVTTEAFEAFIRQLDPKGSLRDTLGSLDPDDLDSIGRTSSQLQDLCEQNQPSRSIQESITSAYGQLCGGTDLPVAVRSSATCEDSAEASFAGLQDTYLWVRGAAAVVEMTRVCWASLYNPESISYRLRLNLPEDQIAMGVVVQEMVDARCSGVMFTRSPTTGDRSVVTLEASWGLGSSIVSGEVTPDKYVVNKVTGDIIDRVVACKLMRHVPVESGGGVVEQAVPVDQQTTPCLSDDEIKALVTLARQTESHYGCAQDMEWAIAHGDKRIYLLQSRPETIWSNKEVRRISTPKKKAFEHVFSALGGKQDP